MNWKKNKITGHIWILIAIIAVGIFLRTYNLREWLYFYPDQARDATIVEEVLDGERSWPLMGPIAASTKFKIGPIYYYFQIISAKIFGTGPEKMAYPDLFFTILSIPLLYYFLSRYFKVGLSLALTGLYSVSFFAVEYSRHAWNPNPIPFFVLLFLLSAWRFLVEKNKTGWLWIIAIGLTLGVGVQLHTLLLLLLPAVLFFVFAYLIKKDFSTWKKWLAVFALVVFLNAPQIASEMESGYANSKVFLKISDKTSEGGKAGIKEKFGMSVMGGSQANAHILSSLGNKLDFDFFAIVKNKIRNNAKFGSSLRFSDHLIFCGIFLSVLFFFFGHIALVYYWKKEKDREKKHFLGLIILFSALSFLIMLPIMDSLSIRYFVHLIFAPFLFLGFLIKILVDKFPRLHAPAAVAIFSLLAISNFFTLGSEAVSHAAKNRSDERYIVL